MRILIIEDNQLTRLMMVRSLQKWGYEVDGVDNINAGLEQVLEQKIQFVITDWMMPGGNGTLFCEKIRTMELPYYVYIILVTALDDSQSLVQGMDSGADDFIRKPIQLDELRARIRAGERVLHLERTLQENNVHLAKITEALLASNEIISRDLQTAEKMQRNLLPKTALCLQGLKVNWLFHPSQHVSGDIFNFFNLDDQHIGFYLIDVAGHGIASAMQSFTLSRVLLSDLKNHNSYNLTLETIASPTAVVEKLNRQFQTDSENILYFTMVYGVADTQRKCFDLCVAGHPYPLYVAKDQGIFQIDSSGLPVGIIPDVHYKVSSLEYQSGDRLFLYSDCITECFTPEGEMFGCKRLMAFVDQHRGASVEQLIANLDVQLRDWTQKTTFDDDISLLVLEIC